jgi:hypothetical protein
MIVAMICITALIGLGVTMINGLLRLEWGSRQVVEDSRALDRLAARFRADCHAATRLVGDGPNEPGSRESLTLERRDGGRVEYRTSGAVLVVTRSHESGEPTILRVRQKTFGTPRLSWERLGDRTLARLSFARPGDGPLRELRIEAVLDRDRGDSQEDVR